MTEFFEVGKYYRHSGGGVIHIVGSALTTMYGWTLIAEDRGDGSLRPVGQGKDYAVNWEETTEKDWLSEFNPTSPAIHNYSTSG